MKGDEKMGKSEVLEMEKPMDFTGCLNQLIAGNRCKRLEWEDGSYLQLLNEQLMIFVPADSKLHPLTVSVGDITAKDWIVMGRERPVS